MSRFDFLKNKYAKVGFWGMLVAAICCFTPLLMWGFATVGLAAFTAYLDYVLLPALFIFMALLLIGYNQYQKNKSSKQKDEEGRKY
ncbi:mercury resistance system transport protein MerF [Aliifodinibius sp. S!AR15-10]|uniref:mercury resistance system transport protein MerF n=1 Tax=Aliifodinibius sp. S!AR15-10 TaxID=2950437 RepID=UPI0028618C3A|nr:mercury resistance system transport protein MerF [Aliifodinibius sp. S!AR15-10]MDR8390498.1 mercury resistance system transport protein MerF [Aliifodinibius sp. S!AR15-10]